MKITGSMVLGFLCGTAFAWTVILTLFGDEFAFWRRFKQWLTRVFKDVDFG